MESLQGTLCPSGGLVLQNEKEDLSMLRQPHGFTQSMRQVSSPTGLCAVLSSSMYEVLTSHHTRGMNKAEQHAQSLQRDLM